MPIFGDTPICQFVQRLAWFLSLRQMNHFETVANEKFYLQQLQTNVANEVAKVASRIFVNNL